MPENWDDVNIGNPYNARHDEEQRNDAKVTRADHPPTERAGGKSGPPSPKREDVHDGPSASANSGQLGQGKNKDERGRSVTPGVAMGQAMEAEGSPIPAPVTPQVPQAAPVTVSTTPLPASAAGSTPPALPPKPGHVDFDIHAETVRDPGVEMPGELTSHADPLSGETGMHPVGVGVGAAAGGAAAGAVVGIAAGAVAGPLGAAIGAAVGTTLGALGGGYTGKHIAEKVNPTTENHYWRHAFATKEYVPRGAKYETWEPAFEYGIEMREWLIDKTWEEAEEMIRAGWMESEAGKALPWEQAKPAIQDAWDHLTPEPGEPEVTEAEKQEDD